MKPSRLPCVTFPSFQSHSGRHVRQTTKNQLFHNFHRRLGRGRSGFDNHQRQWRETTKDWCRGTARWGVQLGSLSTTSIWQQNHLLRRLSFYVSILPVQSSLFVWQVSSTDLWTPFRDIIYNRVDKDERVLLFGPPRHISSWLAYLLLEKDDLFS